MLDFAFVGIGHTHTWNSFGVRAAAPHPRDGFPIARAVLHLGPDEIVARVGHGAIGGRISRAEYRTTGYFLAPHHLQLHGVPDVRVRRRIEGRSVFPCCRIDHSLIDTARKRFRNCAAVLAGRRRQRELQFSRIGVIGIGICTGRQRLPRRDLSRCLKLYESQHSRQCH